MFGLVNGVVWGLPKLIDVVAPGEKNAHAVAERFRKALDDGDWSEACSLVGRGFLTDQNVSRRGCPGYLERQVSGDRLMQRRLRCAIKRDDPRQGGRSPGAGSSDSHSFLYGECVDEGAGVGVTKEDGSWRITGWQGFEYVGHPGPAP